jgi:hypothetical protein
MTGRRDRQPLRLLRIKAKSFTIDGEAVVLGPDDLSRFEELRSREGAGPREQRADILRCRRPIGDAIHLLPTPR